MLSETEEKSMKEKQDELHLTDRECYRVVENLMEFFSFTDAQAQLSDYIMKFLEGREKNDNNP